MTAYVVSSGQVSSGITLNSGDTLTVQSGGSAVSTTVNNDSGRAAYPMLVLSGGFATQTLINPGGVADERHHADKHGRAVQPRSGLAPDPGRLTRQHRAHRDSTEIER